MLQLMYLELGKIFKQLKREKKSEKKIKKMRERTDVYGCTGIGGEGYSVHSWAAVYCIATVYDARLLRCIWL